jgi:hypothetical protein
MLWTLGSAIILGCFRALGSRHEDLPEETAWVLPIYHLGYSLTLGAQVGSVLLFGVRRIGGQSGFPAQPGHWLLLVEGVSALLMFAGYGLFVLSGGQLDPSRTYLYFALQIPNLTACTVGYGLAYALTTKGSPWRLALGICAVVHGVQCLLFAASAVTAYWAQIGRPWFGVWEIPQSCLGLTLGLTVSLASLADWRNNAKRDVLAWAGIGGFIGNIVLHFAYRLIVFSP